MRKNLSIALAVTLFSLVGTAQAQGYGAPFGHSGQITFGAERLFGFHWASNSYKEFSGDKHSGSGTSVGVGWQFAQHMQFNQPRLGVDVFVVDDISLGGSIGFFSMNNHGDGGGTEDGFLISPRVGFNIPLSRSIAFWPKVGLTYISVGRDHAFGLGGEANFAFFPRPSWAFLVTPTVDLAPFGGSDRDGNTPNADYQAYAFGVSVGLLGVLN
jgi:hypothetical protein